MSNLESLIQKKVPILKFHEKEVAFPICASDLLAESPPVDGNVKPPTASILELADFNPNTPVYVKYRRHEPQAVDIQFLWFFYPSKWAHCTLELIDGQITKIALFDTWYPANEFQIKDGRPIIYVTKGHLSLFPLPQHIILKNFRTTTLKGHELSSPPVLLGGNDYQIKSPNVVKGDYIDPTQSIEGDPKLLNLMWDGKKMPPIPECLMAESLPFSLEVNIFYMLVFIAIVIIALMVRHARSAYRDYRSHETYHQASKIIDSYQ